MKTKLQCAGCGHNVEINTDEIENSIKIILYNIRQQSNEQTKYLDALTFIDLVMKCCKNPYYEAID